MLQLFACWALITFTFIPCVLNNKCLLYTDLFVIMFVYNKHTLKSVLKTPANIIKFFVAAKKSKKAMQTLYSPGQALRVPGGWGYQISRQSTHEGGKIVSPTQRPPLPARKYSLYSFLLEAKSTPGLLICDWVRDLTALADVPFVPHIDLWESCCFAKVPDGPPDFLMSSGFKKKELRYTCLSEAKVSHSQRMWAEVSSSALHLLHSGLSDSPSPGL